MLQEVLPFAWFTSVAIRANNGWLTLQELIQTHPTILSNNFIQIKSTRKLGSIYFIDSIQNVLVAVVHLLV